MEDTSKIKKFFDETKKYIDKGAIDGFSVNSVQWLNDKNSFSVSSDEVVILNVSVNDFGFIKSHNLHEYLNHYSIKHALFEEEEKEKESEAKKEVISVNLNFVSLASELPEFDRQILFWNKNLACFYQMKLVEESRRKGKIKLEFHETAPGRYRAFTKTVENLDVFKDFYWAYYPF